MHGRTSSNNRKDCRLQIIMYQSGFTMQSIADHIGVTKQRIKQILHREGIESRSVGKVTNPKWLNDYNKSKKSMEKRIISEVANILTDWPICRISKHLGYTRHYSYLCNNRRYKSLFSLSEQIIPLYKIGISQKDIAIICGSTLHSIRQQLVRLSQAGEIKRRIYRSKGSL